MVEKLNADILQVVFPVTDSSLIFTPNNYLQEVLSAKYRRHLVMHPHSLTIQ